MRHADNLPLLRALNLVHIRRTSALQSLRFVDPFMLCRHECQSLASENNNQNYGEGICD
jgi:hypothetical protein